MRNRESEGEKRAQHKRKAGRREEGAKICGHGRHPMAKLAGETMAKCQAGPPLRIETGRPQEWHTRTRPEEQPAAVQVTFLLQSDEYHKRETS